MSKKINIDIWRFIVSFLIVAIHISPFAKISPEFDFFFTRILGRIAVPLFLMLLYYCCIPAAPILPPPEVLPVFSFCAFSSSFYLFPATAAGHHVTSISSGCRCLEFLLPHCHYQIITVLTSTHKPSYKSLQRRCHPLHPHTGNNFRTPEDCSMPHCWKNSRGIPLFFHFQHDRSGTEVSRLRPLH